MKESIWGVYLITFGVIVIMVIYFFQSVTNTDEQNYNLLKETTESAMFDAFDLGAYQATGQIRIDREKFVESFLRRFADNTTLSNRYKIDIYDVNEEPPKVSIRVISNEKTSATGEIINFAINNKLDAIMEVPY